MLKTGTKKKKTHQEGYWQLVWWRFKKNKLALVGAIFIISLYVLILGFAGFIAPYSKTNQTDFPSAPPTKIVFKNADGKFSLFPSALGYTKEINQETYRRTFVPDKNTIMPIKLFIKGDKYRFMGFIPTRIHLFGVEKKGGYVFLFGTDKLGHDLFSRILYGGVLSLTIGLLGNILTLVLGTTMGLISCFYGGIVDTIIQRTTEFLSAFPAIPLFMALSAGIPPTVSPAMVYFLITLILVFVNWSKLCRQIRGMGLSLREREYVLAAESAGASDMRIIFRHILPGTTSHLIVVTTLSIPYMILAETALSWLGLGLRPPMVSWGVLLNEVIDISVLHYQPWLLIIIIWVIFTVMSFNMLGDGLRDALDPYSGR